MWKAWQEGLANEDSSKLAGLLTDDFVFITRLNTRTRQLTLDWTAAGGTPSVIDDLKVLYENDEVAMVQHSANNGKGDSTAMALYTKKDGKFSQAEVLRAAHQNVAQINLVCKLVCVLQIGKEIGSQISVYEPFSCLRTWVSKVRPN